MAITVSGPCSPCPLPVVLQAPIVDGNTYAVTGPDGSINIVYGRDVSEAIQAKQRAFLNQQAKQQQIQPQIFVQQPNNSTSPLPGLLGLVVGAFASISLLRSPHMQIGIHNIGDFAKETLGHLVKQTGNGLKTLETKLAPTTDAKVGQQVRPTV